MLAEPAPSTAVAARHDHELPVRRQRTSAEYQAAVAAAVEEIKAGEAFQIVVSQRFEVDTTADALDIYRVLRLTNPSPYMYLLRLEDSRGQGFDIVGSSPEALVTVTDNVAVTHPDRRFQAARGRSGRGRRAGVRAARRSQGAGGARDAGRPRPQRSRPGVRPRHGRGDRVHGGPPLQPHHASGVHGAWPGAARAECPRRGPGRIPGRHPVRRSQGAGDGDHRRAGSVAARTVRRGGRLPRLRR